MPRLRTAKSAASRIDVLYFKHRPPLRKIRIVLIVLCILGAGAWYAVPKIQASMAKGGKRGENAVINALFNPGHLTKSHALFQNDCSVCHNSVKEGGFFSAGKFFSGKVSDESCLKCHDVAIHASAQKAFVMERKPSDPSVPKNADGTPAYKAGDPRLMVSSDCVRCHTEHRGEQALAGTTDSHCTQCHGDLPAHTKAGMAHGIEPRVTGFSKETHPTFGKHPSTQPGTLLAIETPQTDDGKPGQPTLVDKTVLRFNHAKHSGMDALRSTDRFGNDAFDCQKCHTTREPNPISRELRFLAEGEDEGADPNVIYLKPGVMVSASDRGRGPPWRTAKERPASWDSSASREYMRPISFQRHCIGCHRIELPTTPGITIPHEDLSVVREVVAGLRLDQQEWIAGKPQKPAAPAATGTGSGAGSPATPPPSTGGPPRPPRPGRYMGPDKAPLQEILFAPPRPGQSAAGSSGSSSAAPATAGGVTMTANDVAIGKLEKMLARVPASGKTMAKDQLKALKDAVKASAPPPSTQPSATETPWQVDPSVTEMYVVFFGSNSCVYCHEVKGDVKLLAPPKMPAPVAAAPAETSAAPRPGRPPRAGSSSTAAPVVTPAAPFKPLLATVPTGVSGAPRRWFEHSVFDHNGHRNMTCVSCHDWAEVSRDTKDLLVPNLNWTIRKRDKNDKLLAPADFEWTPAARVDPKYVTAQSCLDCHHAPTKSSPGAGNNCQMCHSYHNRSIEGRAHGIGSITELIEMAHPIDRAEAEAPSTQPAAPEGTEPAPTAPTQPSASAAR